MSEPIDLFCEWVDAGPDDFVDRFDPAVYAHHDYTKLCYMWELAEQGRRFLLVGVFQLLLPGSITQILVAFLFAFLYAPRNQL